MDFFDIPADTSKIDQSNGQALIRKGAFNASLRADTRNDNFNKLMDDAGGLPGKHEYLALKSNGLSDTGSIFSYIVDHFECGTLYLSTWIISRPNIDRICEVLDSGRLERLVFVVSTRLKQLKKSNYAYLCEQLDERSDKCKYKIFNSHAKTFSIDTKQGDFFTVTGSGNWTENPRIENYLILNNEDLFNHHKQWMTELIP